LQFCLVSLQGAKGLSIRLLWKAGKNKYENFPVSPLQKASGVLS